MENMETRSSNDKDESEKFDPKGYFQRRLFALVIADLIFFTLFGFLFLVPIVIQLNLLIVLSLMLIGFFYTIKNKGLKLIYALALLLSLAIFYVNFMMIFGNRVSELLNG